MSSLGSLYGYDTLSFAYVEFGDIQAPMANYWVQECEDILKAHKDNLCTPHNRKTFYVDQPQVERSLELGYLIYLCLKPYKNYSLKQKGE